MGLPRDSSPALKKIQSLCTVLTFIHQIPILFYYCGIDNLHWANYGLMQVVDYTPFVATLLHTSCHNGFSRISTLSRAYCLVEN